MPKVSEEHRTARRDQILHAAIDCVAREGFHKSTMAHVIDASGLSAGAVYGYFRSKDELIAAMAEHALGLISTSLEQFLRDRPTPTVPELIGQLATTVETRLAGAETDLTKVIVAAWAEAVRDENVRQVAAPKVKALRGIIAGVIEQLQSEGRWHQDADPQIVAQAVAGLIPGFILQRLIIRDVDAESYVTAVTGLMRG